jgi:glutathione synthase/RimK-type ligase-like ATP-grasp enzyme
MYGLAQLDPIPDCNRMMEMQILIVTGPSGVESRNNERYRRILDFNGIAHATANPAQICAGQLDRETTHCIYYYSHRDSDKQFADAFLPFLERSMGIACFPSANERAFFDNKSAQAIASRYADLSFVDSRVFFTFQDSVDFAENATYPLVAKLSSGAGSGNVVLIRNRREAERAINRLFYGTVPFAFGLLHTPIEARVNRLKNSIKGLLRDQRYQSDYWASNSQHIIFQEFLPKNAYDTRITIVGDRAYGYRRNNRPGDFRASGSGLNEIDPSLIDQEMIEMSFTIADRLEMRSIAIDFLYDTEGRPRATEIGYRYVTEYLHKCPGTWDRGINWIPGHIWPETLHVKALTGNEEIEEPTDL